MRVVLAAGNELHYPNAAVRRNRILYDTAAEFRVNAHRGDSSWREPVLFASSQYSRTEAFGMRAGCKRRHCHRMTFRGRTDTCSSGLNGELDGIQGDFVMRRSRVHHRSWELLSRSREIGHPVAENGHRSRRTAKETP